MMTRAVHYETSLVLGPMLAYQWVVLELLMLLFSCGVG